MEHQRKGLFLINIQNTGRWEKFSWLADGSLLLIGVLCCWMSYFLRVYKKDYVFFCFLKSQSYIFVSGIPYWSLVMKIFPRFRKFRFVEILNQVLKSLLKVVTMNFLSLVFRILLKVKSTKSTKLVLSRTYIRIFVINISCVLLIPTS